MVTPEEIRAEAIERIARHLFNDDDGNLWWDNDELRVGDPEPYRQRTAGILDALGDMLPDEVVYAVGGEFTRVLTSSETHARRELAHPQRTAASARLWRRWTHSWTEVTE